MRHLPWKSMNNPSLMLEAKALTLTLARMIIGTLIFHWTPSACVFLPSLPAPDLLSWLSSHYGLCFIEAGYFLVPGKNIGSEWRLMDQSISTACQFFMCSSIGPLHLPCYHVNLKTFKKQNPNKNAH